MLEAADSRAALEMLARFVFAADDHDRIVPLREVLAHAREPIVAAELARRAAEVTRLVPTLHPFYRNAGLSLAEVFVSRDRSAAMHAGVCAAFDADWRDATELEEAARTALDRLEGGAR